MRTVPRIKKENRLFSDFSSSCNTDMLPTHCHCRQKDFKQVKVLLNKNKGSCSRSTHELS